MREDKSSKRKPAIISPIILAAGGAPKLPFPKALSRFGGRTALQIAVENCRGLGCPVVVLGDRAGKILPFVPRGIRVVRNRRWRAGMLGSLLAALRHVPAGAALLIYPVDHPRIRKALIERLAREYARRARGQLIVMPQSGSRAGHPVIFAPDLRGELREAGTAREVTYRDRGRVRFVPVRTAAIFEDFDSPASYLRLAKQWRTAKRVRRATGAVRGRNRARRLPAR